VPEAQTRYSVRSCAVSTLPIRNLMMDCLGSGLAFRLLTAKQGSALLAGALDAVPELLAGWCEGLETEATNILTA